MFKKSIWPCLLLTLPLILISTSKASPVNSQFINDWGIISAELNGTSLKSARNFIRTGKSALKKIPEIVFKFMYGSKGVDRISLRRQDLVRRKETHAPSTRTAVFSTNLPSVDKPRKSVNTSAEEKTQATGTSLTDLPADILNKIVDLATPKSNANLSQTSKHFRRLTKIALANLQDVRAYCGNRIYYKLILDGHYIFSSGYKDDEPIYTNEDLLFDRLQIHQKCMKALLRNVNLVKKRLDSFTVRITQNEIDDSFFQDLGKLLSIKTFKSIIVKVNRFMDNSIPLSEKTEKKLLDTFATTKIQRIDFHVPLSHPRNINSKMVQEISLLPYSKESDSLGKLNSLKSIEIKGRKTLESESNWSLFYSTICAKNASCSIERVKHSSHYMSDSLNRFPSLEAVLILDSAIEGRVPFVSKLFSMAKPPKEFGVVCNYPINMTQMFPLLEKWKNTLQSLTFSIFSSFQILPWLTTLNYIFFESKCLTELSIVGELGSTVFLKVYEFIGNHETLSKLTLHLLNRFTPTESEFLEFYTKLVASLLHNWNRKLKLKNVNIISILSVVNYECFLRKFSKVTAPLYGKGFTLNGMPVERVVDNLSHSVISDNRLRTYANIDL